MCDVASFLLLPVSVAFIVINLLGMRHYYRFRSRLARFVAHEELSRRGEIDGESGELVLRFFFLKTYQGYGDPELHALGDTARKFLFMSLVAGAALIGSLALASARVSSWSALVSCYAL